MITNIKKALICGLLIATVEISWASTTQSSAVGSCRKLPAAVSSFIRSDKGNFAGWHIVNLDDLNPEDRAQWKHSNHADCPGYARAHFDGTNVMSYAITLMKRNQDGSQSQTLIVVKDAKNPTLITLSPPELVARLSIVRSLPSGHYADVEEGGEINTRYPVIVYEALEAGALLYYWDNGHFSSIVMED